MKYFSKTISAPIGITPILDLIDVPSLFTSCNITLRANILTDNTAYTLSLRGADGSKFDLIADASAVIADDQILVKDIILNKAPLPGQVAPLTKLEIETDQAMNIYITVEKLED